MRRMAVTVDGQSYEVELESLPAGGPAFRVRVNGESVRVLIPNLDGQLEGLLTLVIEGRPYELIFDRDLRSVLDYSGAHEIRLRELEAPSARSVGKSGPVKAPIPGQIAQVLVVDGQAVEAGQPLLLLEAMKMQNEIRSPAAGVVLSVQVTAGQTVARGDVLVVMD